MSVAVPSVVAPSRNVIVPVGVPEPGATAVTVAVKVTDCPETAEPAELLTVVLEPAWAIVSVRLLLVLTLKLALPP